MVTQMLQDNFRMRRLDEGEWLPALYRERFIPICF